MPGPRRLSMAPLCRSLFPSETNQGPSPSTERCHHSQDRLLKYPNAGREDFHVCGAAESSAGRSTHVAVFRVPRSFETSGQKRERPDRLFSLCFPKYFLLPPHRGIAPVFQHTASVSVGVCVNKVLLAQSHIHPSQTVSLFFFF